MRTLSSPRAGWKVWPPLRCPAFFLLGFFRCFLGVFHRHQICFSPYSLPGRTPAPLPGIFLWRLLDISPAAQNKTKRNKTDPKGSGRRSPDRRLEMTVSSRLSDSNWKCPICALCSVLSICLTLSCFGKRSPCGVISPGCVVVLHSTPELVPRSPPTSAW